MHFCVFDQRIFGRIVCPVFLSAIVLSVGTSALAQNSPRQVRISYADADTQSAMGVVWNSDLGTPQYLHYGLESTEEHEVLATVLAPLDGGLGYVHRASLTGLLPNTEYFYRVGAADVGWAPASGSYSFRTGPSDPCAPFSFVALGDTRGTSIFDDGSDFTEWGALFDQVAAEDPAFVAIAGDLVENGSILEEWQEFLNLGIAHMPRLPVMPGFGNHDRGSVDGESVHVYEKLFELPRNDRGDSRYYHFKYGNLLMVAINSEEVGTGGDFAEQAAWLETVLEENPATWIMLFLHHPLWTTTPGEQELLGCSVLCGHPPNEKNQNGALLPLIDRYDIDVVIQSHNHFYERSLPMRQGGAHASGVEVASTYRGTTADVRVDGRVPQWGSLYVVTGGGGAIYFPRTIIENSVPAPGQAFLSTGYHYLRFAIDGGHLTMDMVNDNGEIEDSVSIDKLPEHQVEICPTSVDGGPMDDGGDADSAGGDDGDGDTATGDNVATGDTGLGDDGGIGGDTDEVSPGAAQLDQGCQCSAPGVSGAPFFIVLFWIFGEARRRRWTRFGSSESV